MQMAGESMEAYLLEGSKEPGRRISRKAAEVGKTTWGMHDSLESTTHAPESSQYVTVFRK